MGYKIPTVLNNFNSYGAGHKYVGVSNEVTLPNFEYMTETIDGAGIAGEIEEAIEGAFGSLETETTFGNISREYFDFLTQTRTDHLPRLHAGIKHRNPDKRF